MSKDKTLLILGNGADLHLGYKTKWSDYWDWRREQIFDNYSDDEIDRKYDQVLDELKSHTYKYDAFDDRIMMLNNSEKAFDKACEIKDYIENEFADLLYRYDASFDMKKDVIIGLYWHSPNQLLTQGQGSLDGYPITEYDTIFAILSLIPSLYTDEDNHLWMDIEACINDMVTSIYCGDQGGHESHGMQSFILVLDTVFKRFKSQDINLLYLSIYVFISSGYNLSEKKDGRDFFEKTFKKYIALQLANKDDTHEMSDLIVQLLERGGITSDNSDVDILDFNYEMISEVAYTLAYNVDHVFQPHGNISKKVIIGGNYDLDENIRRRDIRRATVLMTDEDKKLSLAKRYRDSSLEYISANCLATNPTYFVDLENYSKIIIYGWSVNDIDETLFKDSNTKFEGDASIFIYGGRSSNDDIINRLYYWLGNSSKIFVINDDKLS